jgi:hypothetical protein
MNSSADRLGNYRYLVGTWLRGWRCGVRRQGGTLIVADVNGCPSGHCFPGGHEFASSQHVHAELGFKRFAGAPVWLCDGRGRFTGAINPLRNSGALTIPERWTEFGMQVRAFCLKGAF